MYESCIYMSFNEKIMQEYPLISVIIPVYNTEQYLSSCLKSILSQTFYNFEVLLINDGSTDHSGVLCDEFVKQDSRVRVFHQENTGVSAARNVGLKHANGKWITFVDSDDELMPDALESMIGMVHDSLENVDLVLAGYDTINISNGLTKSTSSLPFELRQVNRDNAIELMYRSNFYLCFICSKLYKTSVIRQNKLLFDETIYYSEDRLFIIQYLCNCTKLIKYTTKSVYKYYFRSNSAMMSLVDTFNYKSITGFYATLLMYKTLSSIETTRKNIFYAVEDVINSYDYTFLRMKEFSINDKELEKKLRKKLLETLTYRYYLFRFRQMISSFKKKFRFV